MSGLMNTFFNCALLWIYLETIWFVSISILYYFWIPWIVWGSVFLIVILWIVKNAPPNRLIVEAVLGVDPYILNEEDVANNRRYCMRVVAHRGGGLDYPENSLSAFKNSKDKGCTAVEFDLSFTKDNIPIIFHDDTIERLTGKTGIVKEMNWEELKQLDISTSHPLREKFVEGETIALFSETLEQCLQHDLRVFIDVKEKNLEIVQVILDAYKKHPELYRKAVVTSFHPLIIYMLRRRDPQIIGSFSYRPYFFSATSYGGIDGPGEPRHKNLFKHLGALLLDSLYEWALPRFIYKIVGISTILLHKDIVSPQLINKWKKRGVRVMAWTVNRPSEKSHFSKVFKITYLTDTLLTEKVS